MALSEAFTTSSQSISTTEYSLTNNSTSLAAQTNDGIYQVFIETINIAAGDSFQIRVYEKVYSSATQRVIYEEILNGAQSNGTWVSPSLILMHGWDVSIKKLAGTDRNFGWSVRQVA